MTLKNRLAKLEQAQSHADVGCPVVEILIDGSGFRNGGKIYKHLTDVPAPGGRGYLIVPEKGQTPEQWGAAVAIPAKQRPDYHLWREVWPDKKK